MKKKMTAQSVSVGVLVIAMLALGLGGVAMLDSADSIVSNIPMVTVKDVGLPGQTDFTDSTAVISRQNPAAPDNVADITIALKVSQVEAGYLVSTASSNKLRDAGLRSGDVITAINNRIVSEPSNDMRILQSTRESGEAELLVTRGSEQLFMSMSLD